MSGGGQERGIRSGTVPAMLAVGLGEAARVSNMVRLHVLPFVHSFTLWLWAWPKLLVRLHVL